MQRTPINQQLNEFKGKFAITICSIQPQNVFKHQQNLAQELKSDLQKTAINHNQATESLVFQERIVRKCAGSHKPNLIP